jgi:hypothetical protein
MYMPHPDSTHRALTGVNAGSRGGSDTVFAPVRLRGERLPAWLRSKQEFAHTKGVLKLTA